MELRYAFDKSKFRLGTLCKHGHEWPGTGQSLRRIHPLAPACAGCSGRTQSDWLLSFLDYEAMGWPSGLRLGRLCGGGHQWQGLSATLRVDGRCLECDQDKAIAKRKTLPSPRLTRQEYRRAYKARRREELRKQGLTSRGTVPIKPDGAVSRDADHARYRLAIRNAGRMPSVAALVMESQRLYWAENPAAYKEHRRQWAKARWWLRYAITPDLRLYHREKSKRRKALGRWQTPVKIPVTALRQRFNEFGNCCAYCGQSGDMQIEHVEPLDSGGLHDIGNIVPACSRCNTSKHTRSMEDWYRSQPFFDELRLQRIRRVTRPPAGQQLALALP